MGTPLARLDFNMVLCTNMVRQLFFTETDGVHLVCMRLTKATSRIRFVNALIELEGKARIAFKLPVGAPNWGSVIQMGSELRSGVGLEIIDTLKTHMTINNPAFTESLCTGTRHITNMLRDALRQTPVRRMPLHRSESAETLPIASDEEREAPPIHPMVFRPALIIDGQSNMVESAVDMARMITTILVNVMHIQDGFNMQQLSEILSVRIGSIMDTIASIRAELERIRRV